jgi:hypothetical protein
MKLIASEDLRPGEALALADLAFIDADGKPCHFTERARPQMILCPPIGLAARALAEGQFIEYDPEGNTADVITKGSFVLDVVKSASTLTIDPGDRLPTVVIRRGMITFPETPPR